MNLDQLVRERRPAWTELGALIVAARGRADRLGPTRARRLGALYRSAAADLALVRRRFPGDPLVAYLEGLVGGARHLVYDSPSRRSSMLSFFARDYWRLVAGRPGLLALSFALLFGSAALGATWGMNDPSAAVGVVPPAFRWATEPPSPEEDRGLSVDEQGAFFAQVATNNIQVTFLAFASGIAIGLGTAFVLVSNGLILGAVAGLAVGAGRGPYLAGLVMAHGVLELSCIVVAGAAGLGLGWAIVHPGPAQRRDALVAEARRAMQIAIGTAPWLVVAGLAEGFVSPAGLGLRPALVVGVGLGVLYWGLVAWRGAAPEEERDRGRRPSYSRARAFARR